MGALTNQQLWVSRFPGNELVGTTPEWLTERQCCVQLSSLLKWSLIWARINCKYHQWGTFNKRYLFDSTFLGCEELGLSVLTQAGLLLVMGDTPAQCSEASS